jgi:ketosteroid isomerase-like protein
MSQEKPEVVRRPLALGVRPRRGLEERVALRFPRVLALGAHTLARLPPRSRLRQVILSRAVRLSLEASNRGDHEATYLLYDRDCESTLPPDLEALGETAPRGREARVRFLRHWAAAWGGFRFETQELIDLGDRVLVIGRIRGSGLSSGAAVDSQWAVLCAVRAGRVVHEQVFLDHAEALAAVGLRESS